MIKVLANEAAVRVDGKWRVLKAILVTSLGGRKVVYLDKDGCEVSSEPLCKSKFRVTKVVEERIVRGGSVGIDDDFDKPP
jgi:hypothetical protein